MNTKKQYKKPSMKIVLLQHRTQLLAGSNEPNRWGSPVPNNPWDFD